jgi:hypothetical protein
LCPTIAIGSLQAACWSLQRLFDTTYFAGLRNAGMPEQ